MHHKYRLPVLLLLTLALLASLASFLSTPGCVSPGAGQLPSRAWVDASRAFHGVIGARFQAYVAADPALDDVTRGVLARTVDDWDLMIRTAEAALPPATPPPAPAAPGGGQ